MRAMHINMGRGNRRQVFQIAFLDRIAGGSQVTKRRLHVARIPDGNNRPNRGSATERDTRGRVECISSNLRKLGSMLATSSAFARYLQFDEHEGGRKQLRTS